MVVETVDWMKFEVLYENLLVFFPYILGPLARFLALCSPKLMFS